MPTILIVDDRRDAIEVLQAKLQQKGFVTESTSDAREIAGICERQQIDAIIMDMNMPELDGCEATELLKSEESTSHIPVIMCTSQPIVGDKDRAIQAGCDGFIEKPVHLGTLINLLGQFFEIDEEVPREENDKTSDSVASRQESKPDALSTISVPHPGVPLPNLIIDKPETTSDRKKDKNFVPSPIE